MKPTIPCSRKTNTCVWMITIIHTLLSTIIGSEEAWISAKLNTITKNLEFLTSKVSDNPSRQTLGMHTIEKRITIQRQSIHASIWIAKSSCVSLTMFSIYTIYKETCLSTKRFTSLILLFFPCMGKPCWPTPIILKSPQRIVILWETKSRR